MKIISTSIIMASLLFSSSTIADEACFTAMASAKLIYGDSKGFIHTSIEPTNQNLVQMAKFFEMQIRSVETVLYICELDSDSENKFQSMLKTAELGKTKTRVLLQSGLYR